MQKALRAGVLLLAMLPARAVCAPSSATPALPPEPSTSACPVPGPVSPFESFARVIDDRPSLRLITAAAGESDRQQHATLAAIRIGLDSGTTQTIEQALPGGCIDAETVTRASRLLYTIMGAWPKLGDDDRAKMDEASIWAMASIVVRGHVRPEIVDSALAPFSTTLERLTAGELPQPAPFDGPTAAADVSVSPSREPSATMKVIAVEAKCTANRDASTTRKSEPGYPDIAKRAGDFGTVEISVALDNEGNVRSATAVKASTPKDQGGYALLIASLFSAASSGYTPQVADCKRVGGTYPFIVDFSQRP